MKKLIFLISLIALTTLFNACKPAYVSVRPTYIETIRPFRPSNDHIWVDGNWVWNKNARIYNHNNGYWIKPNRGCTYAPGQWKTSRRGDHWVSGRWR